MGLVSELRRRNVLRMAVLYAVAAWLIMQVADVLESLVGLPAWAGSSILWLLAIGFPIALIFSWFYEITPEGISLEKDVDRAESITHVTGRRLDFIVISLLCAAVIVFAYDKWWIGGPPEKSIAVLAFENMSGDPDQEYFSDGISDELLNLLAQIPELTVISRSSSFSFKGKNVSIPTVAEQLKVTHVLEGSLRKVGNRVRITAQLINASSDSHLWSESYDRELDDIFAVQEEIAGAISNALKVKLALVAGEAVLPTVIKAANTDAYDAYLRGRDLIYRRENLEDAVRHLEHSLRLDNDFAPAHAQLAIAIALGPHTLEEATRKGVPLLDRAQELEPDLAEAHGGRALLALFTGDPESAIVHAQKALASNPNYVDAMNWLQLSLARVGRNAEGIAVFQQMLVADPLNVVGRFNRIVYLGWWGRFEEAHEMADQLVAKSKSLGYVAHADTFLIWEGKIAEAFSWILKAQAMDPAVSNWGGAVNAFIWVGEYDEARRVSDELTYLVDLAEGRFDEAIRATQKRLQLDPGNQTVISTAGNVLYEAGRIGEALPHYERLRDFVPEGRVDPFSYPITMRLALARSKAGDEVGAEAAADIVRREFLRFAEQQRTTVLENQYLSQTKAMVAAFEHDPDRAIAALSSAIQLGLRDPRVFGDPIFEDLWDEPRFVALQQELDEILAVEHDKVLQLICFNNPTPDNWQPLPETCEGVEEQRRL